MQRHISATLGVLAAVVGGFVFVLAGEGVYAFIDTYAPGYFPGCYSGLRELSRPGSDVPRKFAWGQVLVSTGLCGGACTGSVTLLILGFRLGGAVSVLKAYLIVALCGVVGACAGGGSGYLLGATTPDYYRSEFSAGGEAWFNPIHVAVGLGVSQGLLVGLICGVVVACALAWYRGHVAVHTGGTAKRTQPGAAPNPAT